MSQRKRPKRKGRVSRRVLSREKVSIAGEVSYIVRRAQERESRVVALGPLVFFSTVQRLGGDRHLDTRDMLLYRNSEFVHHPFQEGRPVHRPFEVPRMLKGGGLIGGLVALALMLPFLHRAEGQSPRLITLEGIVRSGSNQPLDAVHVAIPELSFDRMLDLSAEGAFKVKLQAPPKTHFRCQITAPGFESKSLTAIIKSGASSLGIVRLKPFVEFGSVLVTSSAEGMVIVDFWLTTKTSKPLIFDNVAIAANDVTKKDAPCPSFESTPQATLRFGGTAIVTHADGPGGAGGYVLHLRALDNSPGEEAAKELAGVVFYNPCGEKLVKLVAPFSFSLAEKDKNIPRKLRIEVPASLAIAEGTWVHPDWRRAIVSLSLRNGGVISAAAE